MAFEKSYNSDTRLLRNDSTLALHIFSYGKNRQLGTLLLIKLLLTTVAGI